MRDMSFHITTFGCQMNAGDSEWLARAMQARGFSEAPFGQASVYILNTCSVRDKPEQKVYSEIGRIRSLTGNDPNVLVCVGGCVAQQVGNALFSRFSQVRLVFGADGIAQAPDAIVRLTRERFRRLSLVDFSAEYPEREGPLYAGTRVPASAFVAIMQGCDNFCSYCIVPYVRGRQKSRRAEAVLEECRAVLDAGAREITLLGQNVNSYGHDSGGMGFTELLYKVAALPGLARLRFITPHPKDLAPELIRAFGELSVLAPRLHLPLQSGSDRILERMGRRYTRAQYLDLVAKLRAARPEMHFSTDIIVGFPGETEEDFQETMETMRQANFVGSFSFVYSQRPGTRAALLQDELPRKEKLERLSRLQEWQYAHAGEMLRALEGETVEVLLEELSPKPEAGLVIWQGKEPRGHTVNVTLTGPEPARGWKGSLVPAQITAAAMHSLRAEQVGEAR